MSVWTSTHLEKYYFYSFQVLFSIRLSLEQIFFFIFQIEILSKHSQMVYVLFPWSAKKP
jgi:hypothetical protein